MRVEEDRRRDKPALEPALPGGEAAAPAREPGQERKRRKKEEKRRRDAHRPLDSWERYRALTDALDEAQQLVDLADHKARFALIIMTALNAVLFVVGTRSDILADLPNAARPWLAGYVAIYGLVALYFFVQAIESLRPRRARPRVPYPEHGGYEEYPLGLRFYEDILQRDAEAYRTAWREIHIGQLNAELALQAHGLARINHAKYAALRRLYMGLQIMTMMVAGLIMAGGLVAYVWGADGGPSLKGGHAKRGGLDVLGAPERVAGLRSREPSGVAYHAGLDRLFVVGDEGRLEELDAAGRPLAAYRVKGNLEDVAVHEPTGQLVLISEKKSELVLYDPRTHQEQRRIKLEVADVLGEEPADRNLGFEGIAFRADPRQRGGGIFYLVHQRAPALLVALSFDPQQAGDRLGAESVLGRWAMPYDDLTAVTYAAPLDRLLVIAEARDRILVIRGDGAKEEEVVLPGLQQEGLCLAHGDLWVADDKGGLLRFAGAEAALRQHLPPMAPPVGAADAAASQR